MGKNDKKRRIDIIDVACIDSQIDKTLLESLEASGIDCHFHCRDGFCGACRTTLLSGTVEYTTDPLAFIDDNEILPCCCYPTTDIKIDIPR